MHLQDKQVVETFEQYKPLFLRYRDKENDIDDELQDSFIAFNKFIEKKNIDDQWFAYELKNYIRGYKQSKKRKDRKQRHISFEDIGFNYETESHHKTVDVLYEEKAIYELYKEFKSNLSEIKLKVLDLLELYSIHAVKPFINTTGYTHTYFYNLKNQIHNEFKQYLRSNGYKV